MDKGGALLGGGSTARFFFFWLYDIALTGLAAMLTAYFSPGVEGSGIPVSLQRRSFFFFFFFFTTFDGGKTHRFCCTAAHPQRGPAVPLSITHDSRLLQAANGCATLNLPW